MKTKALDALMRGIAPVIRGYVATSVHDVTNRLSQTELALNVRMSESLKPLLSAFTELQKDNATLRERIAVLEARPMMPGPAGEPGPPGKDGADGAPGLAFVGVYQDGKTYDVGHVATWAGSAWHCNEATTTKPGDGSKAWTLMVKRGRDGRDAK